MTESQVETMKKNSYRKGSTQEQYDEEEHNAEQD